MDQIPLPQDFKDLLNLLQAHGVRYLLVGGWAVGYHGYPRATSDIDIWIAVDPANAKATADMLKEFIGVDVPAEDFLKSPYILRMGIPPNKVEISTHIDGVAFDECYARRVSAVIQDVPVYLISIEDLLTNKKAAARNKDLADVVELQRIHKKARPSKKRR